VTRNLAAIKPDCFDQPFPLASLFDERDQRERSRHDLRRAQSILQNATSSFLGDAFEQLCNVLLKSGIPLEGISGN
jgi:hypothetical protein